MTTPARLTAAGRVHRSEAIAPWGTEYLLLVVLANTIGLMLILVGVYQTGGELTVRTELAWLNLGVVGLGIAAIANGIWLLRGRRLVGLARAATSLPGLPGELGRRAVSGATEPPGHTLVAAPGMTRYHRPACPMAAGKTVTGNTRAHHELAGRRACGVCEP